jgi:hypothetical protein
MIPLCSRFDSVLFTPKMPAIACHGNYSRSPKGSRLKVGVFDDALVKRLKTKKAKSLFTAALFKARVIGKGHGHAGTVQVHVPVMRDGEPTLKPHVWEMDWERLRKFVR